MVSKASDTESDGENIDIEPADMDLSEEETPKQTLKDGAEDTDSEVPSRVYRMGSQNWRGRVHNKLNRGDRLKNATPDDSSSAGAKPIPEEDSN